MEAAPLLDSADSLLMLNFAVRLLATEMDKDKLIARALDIFVDFSGSECTAVLLLDADSESLCVAGLLMEGQRTYPEKCIPFSPALQKMAAGKKPLMLPVLPDSPYPLPVEGALEGADRICLCVPLVGARNKVLGVVSMEYPEPFRPRGEDILQFIALATFTALAYDNILLFREAIEDDLTGLYHRRYFEIRMHEELSRMDREGGRLAVIYLDLDHFKWVNDRRGHSAGDAVLCAVSKLLKNSVGRGVDVVCRFGGEEFVVLLPGTDLKGGEIVAERIRAAVEQLRIPHPGGELRVTISAGVADAGPGVEAQDLLERADEMLLKAKQSGRNRIAAWGREA
jgi:diguanylate cyclase (GGDEF)-like protein